MLVANGLRKAGAPPAERAERGGRGRRLAEIERRRLRVTGDDPVDRVAIGGVAPAADEDDEDESPEEAAPLLLRHRSGSDLGCLSAHRMPWLPVRDRDDQAHRLRDGRFHMQPHGCTQFLRSIYPQPGGCIMTSIADRIE